MITVSTSNCDSVSKSKGHKVNIFLILVYVLIIGSIELVYLSSVLYKFNQGEYLPLVFSFVLVTIMFVWNFVYRKKYYHELDNKISAQEIQEIVANPRISRVNGFAIFYSELAQGIPPIFKHYVAKIPVVHSILVFVSFKSLPISKIPIEETFLFHRVEPNDMNIYRCVVRYGYTDMRSEDEPFETILVSRLKDFIKREYMIIQEENDDESVAAKIVDEIQREIAVVDRACEGGVIHLVGENDAIARSGAGKVDRVLINYAYSFIRRYLSHAEKMFDIPQEVFVESGYDI